MIRAVVDTMVFAYALLGTPRYRDDADRLLSAIDEVVVPDSVRVELLSAAWQAVRAGVIDADDGLALLVDVEPTSRSTGTTRRTTPSSSPSPSGSVRPSSPGTRGC